MNRRWLLALGVLVALGFWIEHTRADAPAQNFPTATPVQIDLGQAAPDAVQANASATPTRTPTPPGPVQVEPKGSVNVRALPDPGADLLGQARPGEFYNAIRRYYRWIEIQFDSSPNKRGWVFDELVTFHGDENALQSVTSLDEPASVSVDVDATVTREALTMTPGGLLTATAIARTNPVPASGNINRNGTPQPVQIEGISAINATVEATQRVILPTYTYPPGVLAIAPTSAPTLDASATTTADTPPTDAVSLLRGNFPPIVPIAALAILGLLGLLVGSIRR